jgi:trehalose 6-phosphate phosphatase
LTDVLTERRLGSAGDLFPPHPDLRWAYFFDIDGTLAEIAEHPGKAQIERTVRDLIVRLHVVSGGAVAIITGRSIADADGLVGIADIPVAGQHGLERRTSDGTLVHHEFDVDHFASACREIAELAARDERIVPELKGFSIALHYRGAPELEEFVRSLINSGSEKLGSAYTALHGKMVMELKPAGKDKGVAITEFMDEPPFKGRVPLFAGDDVTDEFGFKVVNAAGGHSIKVGGGKTCARWRLRTVTSVRDWLASALEQR